MKLNLENYKDRKINFIKLLNIIDWQVKVYTITNNNSFQSKSILKNIINYLPKWISKVKLSEIPTYQVAFLIVHEAREGILVLLNWWTGGEMIETEIVFVDYHKPNNIIDSPYKNKSLLCVWELEVFAHERKAWIDNILLNADNPNFGAYLSSEYNN